MREGKRELNIRLIISHRTTQCTNYHDKDIRKTEKYLQNKESKENVKN
jgi:hypothetical protein